MARGGTLFSLERPRGGIRCVVGRRPTGSAHRGVVGMRTHLSVALKFTQPNTKQLKVYNPTAPIAFIRCNRHPYLVPEHVITPKYSLFPLSSHATPNPLAPSQATDLCSVPMDLPYRFWAFSIHVTANRGVFGWLLSLGIFSSAIHVVAGVRALLFIFLWPGSIPLCG